MNCESDGEDHDDCATVIIVILLFYFFFMDEVAFKSPPEGENNTLTGWVS